jgi:hypothetical protein
MQQPGILQPAKADSQSIGRRRFTEAGVTRRHEPLRRVAHRDREDAEEARPRQRDHDVVDAVHRIVRGAVREHLRICHRLGHHGSRSSRA